MTESLPGKYSFREIISRLDTGVQRDAINSGDNPSVLRDYCKTVIKRMCMINGYLPG
jgi:hypothetical protein